MNDNNEIYSTVEFESWAGREDLIPEEDYLIENYLQRDAKSLEAGTAGGRILLEMQKRGFSALAGFDFVPEFISQAKRRDSTGTIAFDVQDATGLSYPDATFDQILYLQQIISLIEDDEGRSKAAREAFRILRPGGTALFSFLCFETRERSTVFKLYLTYLRLLRKLRGARRPVQYIPWLKLGGKPNWSALIDRGPYPYWYRVQEADHLLHSAGFKVIAVASGHQIPHGTPSPTAAELSAQPLAGMLYFVCQKPAPDPKIP